jgi:hypothetical protein
MNKQTISRLAVGLVVLAAGFFSISSWNVYIVKDAYSSLPNGEITLNELLEFDAYDMRDTLGQPSNKYIPTWFVLNLKKKGTIENRVFRYTSKTESIEESFMHKKSIAYLHALLRDSSHLFGIGDSISLTLFFDLKEDYEKRAKVGWSYFAYTNKIRTQIYKINDESLVELKREKDLRFKVYPSPAAEEVKVRVDVSISDPGTVVLLDSRGQILEQNESYDVTQETLIELKPYPSGTYYVQVTFKGENFVKKIIKK